MEADQEPASSARRRINTAACLIIGDEVLGGKTVDTNSGYMARWCFKNGISLKRIEVVEDEEDQIVEAARRMSRDYDFVVTSGGIGPTHDDITYSAIAKAFDLPLTLHQATVERMKRLAMVEKDFDWEADTAHRAAKLRMAQLPLGPDPNQSVLFPRDDLWVPVVVASRNVHILPGVPHLFEQLLDGLAPVIRQYVERPGLGMHRVMVMTGMSESSIAPYLTELAAEVGDRGVKVGSYPQWFADKGDYRNTVSLVGRDLDLLESLASDVINSLGGRRMTAEDDDSLSKN